MSLTLVEAAKYSNDVLQRGVLELLVYEDPIFEKLGFVDIVGNGLTYNVETTMPSAAFYDVGDTWVEGTGTVTQTTAVLKILGGDADVDNFLLKTRSNINDLEAETIAAKTKAVKKAFMEAFFYGYITGFPKEFDGLHYLIRSSTSPYENVVPVATTGTPAALSMAKLEEAIDMIKGFDPKLILMSKAMRRYINKYLHGVGGITYMDAADRRVQSLFELPVGVSDYIGDDESADLDYGGPEGYNYADGNHGVDDDGATSIFVLSFDPKGCQGVQSGPLTVEPIGSLETKDAKRWRIKWYCSIMMQSIISCSKVSGIDFDGTVVA